ncbi:efflux RND transporter permease subunit [Pseudomonas aeruginosa]|nr:efflux RND transporter permease subunit [Pseudomonas aeruginosa]
MTNLPQTANLDYLNRYTAEFEGIFRSFLGVLLCGVPDQRLQRRPGGHRRHAAQALGRTRKEPDGIAPCGAGEAQRDSRRADLRLQPAVATGHRRGPAIVQFVLNTANDYESLLQVAQRVKQRASESGKFAFLDLDLAFDKPELVVDIDREKAAQMGVSMQDLGVALASLLGEGEINRFTIDGRSYKVIAQVERPYRDNPGWPRQLLREEPQRPTGSPSRP